MREVSRIATAVVAGMVLLAVPAPVAHAQDVPDGFAPTMLVLDASGSMTAPDPAGGTRMDAAKRAVHALVDAAPADAPFGLAAYGTSTGNSAAEREQGCRDVTVLQAPGPIDKAAIGAAVDAITPRGYTPIGRSLQVAAEQLPQEGPRSIVLVSDGEDTCAPPEPCEVVRTLAGQGVDLVVHTVGFGVEDVARAQLSCIAQTTGGTYTDAPDAEALQRVLPRVTATALRNYQPAGRPLVGAATYDRAPVAGPGQHLDTIGQQEKRYYAVDVPDGATAYFSATVSFPRVRGVSVLDDFNNLQLRTYGADGRDCHEFEADQSSDSSAGATLTVATTWEGATEEDTGRTDADRCRGGGRYYFAVEWERVSLGVPQRLPIELLVGVEPAALDPGPVGVLPPAQPAEPLGAPRPVVGGGSFTVAGTLAGSGTYTDAVARSEFVFYRVRLDWGQALAYRVRFGTTPGGTGLHNLSPISTVFYTPFREKIESEFTAYNGQDRVLPANKPALSTVPVRYTNRTGDTVSVRPQSVAGWYYIAVQVGPTYDGSAAAPVPVALDVTVTGTVEPGPRYGPVGTDGVGQTGPFGGTRPPAAPPADTVAAARPAATTSVLAPVGWAVLGAVVALAAAGAGLALRRRRSPGS